MDNYSVYGGVSMKESQHKPAHDSRISLKSGAAKHKPVRLPDHGHSFPEQMLHYQRTIGNRALQELLLRARTDDPGILRLAPDAPENSTTPAGESNESVETWDNYTVNQALAALDRSTALALATPSNLREARRITILLVGWLERITNPERIREFFYGNDANLVEVLAGNATGSLRSLHTRLSFDRPPEPAWRHCRTELESARTYLEILNGEHRIYPPTTTMSAGFVEGGEIINHWLHGGGRELVINNPRWSSYMMANKPIREQIRPHLINDAVSRLFSGSFIQNFHGDTGTQGWVTGYQVLHGTNKYEGDLETGGTVEVTNNPDGTRTINYQLKYTFNDVTDAITNNDADQFLKTVSGIVFPWADRKDFVLRIVWESDCEVTLTPDNLIRKTRGYPFWD